MQDVPGVSSQLGRLPCRGPVEPGHMIPPAVGTPPSNDGFEYPADGPGLVQPAGHKPFTGGLYVDANGNVPPAQGMLEVADVPEPQELLSCRKGERELHFMLEDGSRVSISELMRLLNSVLEGDGGQHEEAVPLPPQREWNGIPVAPQHEPQVVCLSQKTEAPGPAPSAIEQLRAGIKNLHAEHEILRGVLEEMEQQSQSRHDPFVKWDLPDAPLMEAIVLHNKSEERVNELSLRGRLAELEAKVAAQRYQIAKLDHRDHAEVLRRAVASVGTTE